MKLQRPSSVDCTATPSRNTWRDREALANIVELEGVGVGLVAGQLQKRQGNGARRRGGDHALPYAALRLKHVDEKRGLRGFWGQRLLGQQVAVEEQAAGHDWETGAAQK